MKSFFLILFLLIPLSLFGQEIYLSDKPVTFGWGETVWDNTWFLDCNQNPQPRYLLYEVQLLKDEIPFATYTTRATQITLRPDKADLYVLQVRTKLMQTINTGDLQVGYCVAPGTKVESDWCRSDTICGMLKSGVNGPWQISFQTLPPADVMNLRLEAGLP